VSAPNKIEAVSLNTPAEKAILGHCLEDPEFLKRLSTAIHPNMLQDMYVVALYTMLVAFYEKIGRCPSEAEFDQEIRNKWPIDQAFSKYKDVCREALHFRNDFGQDALLERLGRLLSVIDLRTGLNDAAKAYNAGDTEKVRQVFSQTLEKHSALKEFDLPSVERRIEQVEAESNQRIHALSKAISFVNTW
jgi:hypothetical protein